MVSGFAVTGADQTVYQRDGASWTVTHDPGSPPAFSDQEYRRGFEMVANWSSHCDPADGVLWDVSPASIGNATLPADPSDWDAFYERYRREASTTITT